MAMASQACRVVANRFLSTEDEATTRVANRHGSAARGDPPDPGALRWSSVLLEVMSLMSLEVARKNMS